MLLLVLLYSINYKNYKSFLIWIASCITSIAYFPFVYSYTNTVGNQGINLIFLLHSWFLDFASPGIFLIIKSLYPQLQDWLGILKEIMPCTPNDFSVTGYASWFFSGIPNVFPVTGYASSFSAYMPNAPSLFGYFFMLFFYISSMSDQ